MTENKYVQMMRDEAAEYEDVANYDTANGFHQSILDEDRRLAADWRAAAEWSESLLEACWVVVVALETFAELSPNVQSDGLAAAHKQLLAVLQNAGE